MQLDAHLKLEAGQKIVVTIGAISGADPIFVETAGLKNYVSGELVAVTP